MAAHVNFDLDDAYDDATTQHKDGARPLARLGSGCGEPLCGVIRRGGEVRTIGEAHGAAAELCRKLAQRGAQGWAASSKGDLVGVVRVTADTAAAVVVDAAGRRASLTTKAVATTARAQRACENLHDDPTKLDTTGDGAWCVACGDAAKKLEPCAGRGCAAILCGRCQTAQKRCPGCKSKADARRKVLQRWAKEATKRPALDALARAFGHFSVDGAVTRDAFPSLVIASLGTEAVYDDDDPVLRDAFDACDADGDGLVDLHDVVAWLTASAQRMTRDRATIALARSPLKDDRAAFAAWPEKRGALLLNNEAVDADLGAGRLALSLRSATARVLSLHPAVCRVERSSDRAFTLTCSVGEAEEVLHFCTADASECKAWWTAIGETLAVHRRLKSQPPASADSFDDDSLEPAEDEVDAIEASAGTTSTFRAIASALGSLAGPKKAPPPATPVKSKRVEPSTPGTVGGRSALRRKSVRFSDADEAHVSKGFAFDRVVRKDGTVSWEAATPRRAKAAWRAVVRLVIRPPRASYAMDELGPLSFDVPLLDGKTVQCVRSDFTVSSDEKKALKCSLWSRAFAESAPCVLYLHGNASCRMEALPHVAPLLMLGIQVCAVDTTGSGSSEGKFVTLGLREASDASSVASHLIANKRCTQVALYGRSMGAVAAILAGAKKTGFSSSGVALCVVADSPFASLSQLVDRLARNAAHEALGCDGPSDIRRGERPIDDAFIRDVQEGRTEKMERSSSSFFPSRAGLAESAAKAAIDAVRAEVLKRAQLDVDDVDALEAVEVLEAPLLLVAATDDSLMPPRANAGALLRRYASKGCRRRDAELLLVKGGHNSKRPLTCVKKTYAFLARHLLGEAFDQRKIDRLDAVRGRLAANSPPWAYVARNKVETKGRGAEFRSGMTDARAKAMGRDIKNLFKGGL